MRKPFLTGFITRKFGSFQKHGKPGFTFANKVALHTYNSALMTQRAEFLLATGIFPFSFVSHVANAVFVTVTNILQGALVCCDPLLGVVAITGDGVQKTDTFIPKRTLTFLFSLFSAILHSDNRYRQSNLT